MIDRSSMQGGQAASLRQMMDRLLQDAVVMPSAGGTGDGGGPALDVYEEGDNLVIEAHVPGFEPDQFDLHVERGLLTLSGLPPAGQEQEGRHYLLREARVGRFSRSLQLPASYAQDPSQATYHQGILRLVFPKSEEAKPRRIQVGTGS
jgi:HSP20 family protein